MDRVKDFLFGVCLGICMAIVIVGLFFSHYYSTSNGTIQKLTERLGEFQRELGNSTVLIEQLKVENNRLADIEQQYVKLAKQFSDYQRRTAQQLELGKGEVDSIIEQQLKARDRIQNSLRTLRELEERTGSEAD